MADQPKIAFIGAGNMGRALIKGLIKAQNARPQDIRVHDAFAQAMTRVKDETGVNVLPSATEAVRGAGTILLAVKPGDVPGVLEQIRDELTSETLVVSIAAGVTLSAMEKVLGGKPHLIRAMPNTPAQVGFGATAIAKGEYATEDDMTAAARIFQSVGRVVEVDESLMDAVTGLSGSGPAYVFVIIEALADAGVLAGLPRTTALELAAQTVRGAAEMVLESDLHPAALKDMVTSPGGTTAAGLNVLERGALRGLIIHAVKVATHKSARIGAAQKSSAKDQS